MIIIFTVSHTYIQQKQMHTNLATNNSTATICVEYTCKYFSSFIRVVYFLFVLFFVYFILRYTYLFVRYTICIVVLSFASSPFLLIIYFIYLSSRYFFQHFILSHIYLTQRIFSSFNYFISIDISIVEVVASILSVLVGYFVKIITLSILVGYLSIGYLEER